MFCDPRRTQAATVTAIAGSTKVTFRNDVEDYYDTFGDDWGDTFDGDDVYLDF